MVAQTDGRTDGDKEEGTDGRLDIHIMAKGVVLNWI